MGWWKVSTDSLAGSRFVISPLAETTASLLALEGGTAAHPGERQWLDAHHAAYRDYVKDHPVIPALIRVAAGHRWIPMLITAAPVSPGESSFRDELRHIADLQPDEVAADLEEAGFKTAADDLPRKAAELLEWVWANTVLPYWATRRAIIEADIAARTTQLGRGGWAEALSAMRPGTRWLGDGRLQINALDRPPREISGAQLFFVPVTPSTRGWVAWDEPRRYALIYQCSGVLAGHGIRAAIPETLAALLGPARAAILTLLATPKTTTQLVALTGQRLGSVGRHLQILLAAGLLERRRAGRSVLYRRSPAGDLLVRIQNEAGLLSTAGGDVEGFDEFLGVVAEVEVGPGFEEERQAVYGPLYQRAHDERVECPECAVGLAAAQDLLDGSDRALVAAGVVGGAGNAAPGPGYPAAAPRRPGRRRRDRAGHLPRTAVPPQVERRPPRDRTRHLGTDPDAGRTRGRHRRRLAGSPVVGDQHVHRPPPNLAHRRRTGRTFLGRGSGRYRRRTRPPVTGTRHCRDRRDRTAPGPARPTSPSRATAATDRCRPPRGRPQPTKVTQQNPDPRLMTT
jgi:DNA-binding transcriptional ArsR family regulator